MPSIKINYQPEVFDDEVYCENTEESCQYVNSVGWCELLRCRLVDKNLLCLKDVKCIRLWQQANQSRPPKTLPEGHRLG